MTQAWSIPGEHACSIMIELVHLRALPIFIARLRAPTKSSAIVGQHGERAQRFLKQPRHIVRARCGETELPDCSTHIVPTPCLPSQPLAGRDKNLNRTTVALATTDRETIL